MRQKSYNKDGNLSYHMVELSTLKIRILSLYLEDLSKSFHLREIARTIGKSHVSLIPHLREFVKEKILIVNQMGKNKVYSLNLSNYLVSDYLVVIEKIKAISFIENNSLLKKFYREFSDLKVDLVLFGSFARGDFNSESDVDFLVIGKLSSSLRKRIKDFGLSYSREFHLTIISEEEFYSFEKENPLVVEVLKNHVIFSGVEKFMRERWNKWRI
jgi:uncharacterized protein